MRKHPFLVFAAVMAVLVAGTLAFIQSPSFARTLKKIAAKYLPEDSGVVGDFSELAVAFFPPGISLKNPNFKVKEKNILGLPGGSAFRAERLDIQFLPVQMFYGNVRVHRLRIVQGEARLAFGKELLSKKSKKKTTGFRFSWDSFLKVRLDAVEFENFRVRLEMMEPSATLDFLALKMGASKEEEDGGVAYQAQVDFSEIQGNFPKKWGIPSALEKFTARFRFGSSGLKVESLRLLAEGSSLQAAGTVRADILQAKELPAELEVQAEGELSKIAGLVLGSKKSAELPSGQLRFEGKIASDLYRFVDTLRAEGRLALQNLKYRDWGADSLEVEGKWNGELSISKGWVQSKERPRQGGHQAADGGRIEIGSFQWRPKNKEEISIPLKLERAHIHWLAAAAIKDVYPLDFRVSGPVLLRVKTGGAGVARPWGVDAKLGLTIQSFQLDNQRLGKEKPLRRVISIPRLGLEGNVEVDAVALRATGLQLVLPRSKFQVGGKVDFKEGFDLQIAGNTNLEDLDRLAEVKIRGAGELRAHVHGPSSRTLIDFDADIQNAEYLNLKLGHLLGRITWDDDPQKLIFSNVGLTVGQTSLVADGLLDLRDHETISLGFQISKGDVHDLIGVFENLTQDLWWFPRKLRGALEGQIRVEGGLDLSELDVLAQASGTQWEYFGERFKSVYLRGGFERGAYVIESLKALKRNGKILGHISFDADKKFDWEFHSEELLVVELDHIARLNVPIRGKLALSSRGSGQTGSLDSLTQFSLKEAVVRGIGVAPSELSVRSGNGMTSFKANFFDGQALSELVYNSKQGSDSFFKTSLRQLDFSPLLLLLNPRTIQDRALVGMVSGGVDLRFRAGEVERSSGQLDLSEFVLSKTGARFQLVKPVSVQVEKGSFEIPALTLKGNRGVSTLSLTSRSAVLEGSATGEMDISIAEFLSSAISQAVGTAKLDLAISGTVLSPSVFGRATLVGESVRIHALESPFENIQGVLQLKQNVLSVQNVEADQANGRVNAQGTIELFVSRYPKIALTVALSGNKLKIFPFQYVKIKGNLRVSGEEIPYLVDGDIVIDSAFSKEKMTAGGVGRVLKSARYMPPLTPEQESTYPKFKLNIRANAERGVIVRNELFDAELKGNLTVINTIETPRILGNAEVTQGKMTFKDRVFQIQSATVVFDNPTVLNPRFNLTANAEINNAKIQLYTHGKASQFKVELSSNPVMTEQEILTLLVLGLSADEVKRLGAVDRGEVDKSKATDLLLHSMDFNRDVQEKTGFQFQLEEAVKTSEGTSIFRPKQEAVESSVAPKVILKRRIGKQLALSVGSTVGVGTSTEQEVNAEFSLTPSLSVIGVWDSVGGDATTQDRTSYGVDLKVQRRFR